MDIYQERIRPLFDHSGLQDKELEALLNLPRGVIYKWGTGKYKSYQKYVPQIAAYFHVSTDYLLGNTDDPTPVGQKEKPPAQGGELSPLKQEAWGVIQNMDDETLKKFIKAAKVMLGE